MKLSVRGVSFAYDGAFALEQVDLEARPGEVLALTGPNGAGKTTLLRVMSGALAPCQGTAYLDALDVAALKPLQIARRLSVLEQEKPFSFDFCAQEVVSWGRLAHRRRWGRWSDKDQRAVQRALELTQTQAFAGRVLRTLSGGERQRVFLALALAQEPEALLLDEPTLHLDLNHQLQLLDFIRGLARDGLTVVMALHDLNLAARYADRVAVLRQGRLAAYGLPADVLTERRIQEVWGVRVRVLADRQRLWILP